VDILCDESNLVETFLGNAGVIAEGIQTAHPLTRVSFGLVDYFATHDQWDDSDGLEYHVDVGRFVPATEFQQAVHDTIQTQVLNGSYLLNLSSLNDNLLHSSSITALYGTLTGAGINWSNDAHHIVVWMGTTLPRDPGYPANYCPSISLHVAASVNSSTDPDCYSPTCEPSYEFGGGLVSPQCEGWVTSQDGNSSDSIASLAQTAPDCVSSLGGNCTIDTIQVIGGAAEGGAAFNWTLSGSATSGCERWPSQSLCSSAGLVTTEQILDTQNRTLAATCDLARATGGSWDGYGAWMTLNNSSGKWLPANCDGVTGTLAGSSQTDPLGIRPISATTLNCGVTSWQTCGNFFNTYNPTLVSALTAVGVGYPTSLLAANGSSTQPMFRFVPYGNFQLAPNPNVKITCQRSGGYPTGCQINPTLLNVAGRVYLAMNWSGDPNLNAMEPNDVWTASFDVVATGPPFGKPVPVDACTTSSCLANGSGEVGGLYSQAAFTSGNGNASLQVSFPLALVTVDDLTSGSTPTSSAPPPPPASGIPPPVLTPTPVVTPIPTPVVVTTVTVSSGITLQIVAAGVLAAGFTRAALRLKPLAVKTPMKNVSPVSRFDQKSQAESERFTRFG